METAHEAAVRTLAEIASHAYPCCRLSDEDGPLEDDITIPTGLIDAREIIKEMARKGGQH